MGKRIWKTSLETAGSSHPPSPSLRDPDGHCRPAHPGAGAILKLCSGAVAHNSSFWGEAPLIWKEELEGSCGSHSHRTWQWGLGHPLTHSIARPSAAFPGWRGKKATLGVWLARRGAWDRGSLCIQSMTSGGNERRGKPLCHLEKKTAQGLARKPSPPNLRTPSISPNALLAIFPPSSAAAIRIRPFMHIPLLVSSHHHPSSSPGQILHSHLPGREITLSKHRSPYYPPAGSAWLIANVPLHPPAFTVFQHLPPVSLSPSLQFCFWGPQRHDSHSPPSSLHWQHWAPPCPLYSPQRAASLPLGSSVASTPPPRARRRRKKKKSPSTVPPPHKSKNDDFPSLSKSKPHHAKH